MQDTRFVRGNLALLADSYHVLPDVTRRTVEMDAAADHCGEERPKRKQTLR